MLAQWQRKDFSRNSSYPLVSGSAEGTIRRSVAYRQPVSENRMQESPKGRCIRAVGIFANGSVLDAVGEIKAQKFSLSLPFKISKIVDFGTFAPIAVQALVIGSPLSEV